MNLPTTVGGFVNQSLTELTNNKNGRNSSSSGAGPIATQIDS